MPNIAKHKQGLITAAMRLFRRQGYASTGLSQILEESGAPKGSLYHYFPGGKEELGLAAVKHAGERMCQSLEEIAANTNTPQQFVKVYCEKMAQWMQESEFRSGCPVATTMLETAPQSPQMAAAGCDVLDDWVTIFVKVFRNSGIKPRAAIKNAEQLVALMEGALLVARIRQSTDPILAIPGYCRWN